MPQSYDRIILHTVFGTKNRRPFIDPVIEGQLYRVMTAAFRHRNCWVLAIGGTMDHVHIVHSLPRTQTLADVMREVKMTSSKWIKKKGERYHLFDWQDGYGSFSVDYRKRGSVIEYVRNQRQHHGLIATYRDFRDEFGALMSAYDFDNYTPHHVFPDPPTRDG